VNQATAPIRLTIAMSEAELQARAIARAHDERVHIFAVTGRPGVYRTRSKSDPMERHSLVARDGVEACSCRGFEYRKSCKHIEALRNRLGRESRRADHHPDDGPHTPGGDRFAA
jgi:hypothetical protein